MKYAHKVILIAAALVTAIAGAVMSQTVGSVPSSQPTTLKKLCREIDGLSTTGDIIKDPNSSIANKLAAWAWDAYSGTVSEYPSAFPLVLVFIMTLFAIVVVVGIYVVLKEGKLYIAMFMQWKFPGIVGEAHRKIHEAQGRYTPESLREQGAKLIKELEGK